VGTDHPARKTMHNLTVPQCFDLLAKHNLGRLAFVAKVGVMPLIIPVNYVVDEDTLVFRSDPGSKLTAAIRGAPVAFEVDGGYDENNQTGWSVVVHGHAEEVTDPTELDRLEQLPLTPWSPGPKSHYVRVRPGQINGRRISLVRINLAHLPARWFG
jgi:nitroimidazol reductase NimA-like FMN-containing flavoprotein (pyridoxamine 5'-phosphate oxidase superfamily)